MQRNPDLITLIRDQQEREIRALHLAAIAQCARRCCTPAGRFARLTRAFRPTPIDC